MEEKIKSINFKRSWLGIHEAVEAAEKYNNKHKTCYTYGQFISLLESGKIKLAGR